MKKDCPFPISNDNFPQCWDYVDDKRRTARTKALIAKVGGFFSNLLFLFLLLFAANGLICRYFSGSYCDFLLGLSFFRTPWEQVSSLLLKPGSTLAADLVTLLLTAYLVSALFFLLLTLLIGLIYHPRKKPLPTGSHEENTTLLAKQVLEAWNTSCKTKISSSAVSIVLVIIGAFVLLFGYTIHLQDAQKINAILSRFPTSDAATNSLLYVLFGYFLFHFLSLPLLLITRPLYHAFFPYDLLAQADTAALFAGEDTDGLPPEEVAQRHRCNAVPLREEAITAEEKSGYKIAKELFHKAALGGDVPSMEHYARHCLLDHQKDPARYWLDKAAASGEMSPEGKNMRLRLKMGWNHNLEYLREGQDFSLKAKRIRSAKDFAIKLLVTALVLGLSALVLYAAFRYYSSDTDTSTILEELRELFGSIPDNLREATLFPPK